MGFLDRPAQKSSNPAARFLEWKSDEQKFAYYDKEKKTNIFVDLPITFLVLEEYHTVKGFSDSDQTGIYANEVLQTGTDEMDVKTFKGRTIAKGIYKDIKGIVDAAGGRYHKSIYAVTKDGELINVSFKGACVSKWSDFTAKGAWKRLKDEWVTISESEQLQKGKVKYSVPIFKFDKSLSAKEVEMVTPLAEELVDYMSGYMANQVEVNEPETVDHDDLDF